MSGQQWRPTEGLTGGDLGAPSAPSKVTAAAACRSHDSTKAARLQQRTTKYVLHVHVCSNAWVQTGCNGIASEISPCKTALKTKLHNIMNTGIVAIGQFAKMLKCPFKVQLATCNFCLLKVKRVIFDHFEKEHLHRVVAFKTAGLFHSPSLSRACQ